VETVKAYVANDPGAKKAEPWIDLCELYAEDLRCDADKLRKTPAATAQYFPHYEEHAIKECTYETHCERHCLSVVADAKAGEWKKKLEKGREKEKEKEKKNAASRHGKEAKEKRGGRALEEVHRTPAVGAFVYPKKQDPSTRIILRHGSPGLLEEEESISTAAGGVEEDISLTYYLTANVESLHHIGSKCGAATAIDGEQQQEGRHHLNFLHQRALGARARLDAAAAKEKRPAAPSNHCGRS